MKKKADTGRAQTKQLVDLFPRNQFGHQLGGFFRQRVIDGLQHQVRHQASDELHHITKFTTPKTKCPTANTEANNTAGRFLRSAAKRMNAKQGGRVSRRMTHALAMPE